MKGGAGRSGGQSWKRRKCRQADVVQKKKLKKEESSLFVVADCCGLLNMVLLSCSACCYLLKGGSPFSTTLGLRELVTKKICSAQALVDERSSMLLDVNDAAISVLFRRRLV